VVHCTFKHTLKRRIGWLPADGGRHCAHRAAQGKACASWRSASTPTLVSMIACTQTAHCLQKWLTAPPPIITRLVQTECLQQAAHSLVSALLLHSKDLLKWVCAHKHAWLSGSFALLGWVRARVRMLGHVCACVCLGAHMRCV